MPLMAMAEADTGRTPPLKLLCEARPMCHNCRKILPPLAWTASVTFCHPACKAHASTFEICKAAGMNTIDMEENAIANDCGTSRKTIVCLIQ